MHDFIAILPSEVLSTVFSYLNQHDSVNCMYVCRHWHNTVPKYSVNAWTELHISKQSWPRINICMMQCLGAHVKDISINSLATHLVLNKLRNKECMITSLDIQGYPRSPRVSAVEYLSAITQFGSTLKMLRIANFSALGISEQYLLSACPMLEHLTLAFNPTGFGGHYPEVIGNDYRNKVTSIAYVQLDDIRAGFAAQVTDILRRCPKLRVLVFSYYPQGMVQDEVLSIGSVFSLCPDLRFISWNGHQHSSGSKRLYNTWKESIKRPEYYAKGPMALSALVFQGDMNGLNKAIPILEKSQQSLGYLHLFNCGRNSSQMANLRFPHLKTLLLDEFNLAQNQWTPFILGCQDLEVFKLSTSMQDTDLDAIVRGLQGLTNLRGLRLANLSQVPVDINALLRNTNHMLSSHVSSKVEPQ